MTRLLLLVLLQLALVFAIFSWIYWLVMQFKRAWKDRSHFEKFVTLYALVTLFLFLVDIMYAVTLDFLASAASEPKAYLMGGLTFFIFITYAWIHFGALQLKKPWKKRSGYGKFVTIFAILFIVPQIIKSFILLKQMLDSTF